MNHIRLATLLLLATFFSAMSRAQFPPAPGTGPGLPETIEAIDAARVTTRILYITAHPDDESGAILTYLARGLHADVALLSITRGEGGQNALGPEQAPQLGLIRTQELLAATRGYGVKLYFTRAKDFGFSKTPEETEKVWGDPVMEDMVRVIREFRPTIVINGWGGVHGGHGHHQLSGIWTPKAVKLAADPKFLPHPQFRAWDASGAGVKILDVERGSDSPKGYLLPADDISPLYGKSWREIGLDAFSNHRSQGISAFLSSPFLRRPLALLPEDGSKLDPASLAVTLQAVASVKGPCGCDEQLKEIDHSLESARVSALKLDWPAAVNSLVAAEKSLQRASMLSIPQPIPPDLYNKLDFLGREKQNLDRALQLAAGIQLSADADRADVVATEDFTVAFHCRCRPEVHCQFSEPQFLSVRAVLRQKMESGKDTDSSWTLALGKAESGDKAALLPPVLYPPLDPLLSPERAPVLRVAQKIQIDGFTFSPARPVLCTTATSTAVSRVPLRIVPAYTLAVEPSQIVEVIGQPRKPFDVLLRVHSYSTKPATVSIDLDISEGLQAGPLVEVHFDGLGDQYAKVTVTSANLTPGNSTITAYAKR
ncbi:MAG TPA: PIG-L family deacetylase, partial [Candidatus Sulfotelmatobacter sp.]|nr:PIG-L family deacetylase [Candidatus Sulfotelmatobacter sp.]